MSEKRIVRINAKQVEDACFSFKIEQRKLEKPMIWKSYELKLLSNIWRYCCQGNEGTKRKMKNCFYIKVVGSR